MHSSTRVSGCIVAIPDISSDPLNTSKVKNRVAQWCSPDAKAAPKGKKLTSRRQKHSGRCMLNCAREPKKEIPVNIAAVSPNRSSCARFLATAAGPTTRTVYFRVPIFKVNRRDCRSTERGKSHAEEHFCCGRTPGCRNHSFFSCERCRKEERRPLLARLLQ